MTSLERYVGQTLDGKYRLERLLGQGGMGAVYLATHLGTERYVALKLITPQFMRNEEFVERFKREARAAGRLRHPNVVDVTDFGFSGAGRDRVAYLVMEYLDGCTLSDVLAEEERLPLYWVVDILEQVCAAVHEAHQQGIVHRDLKPDNIWLEPNGLGGYRVKVLDFGIAKLAEVSNAALPATEFSQTADEAPTLTPSSAPIALAAAAGVGEIRQAQATNLESETLLRPFIQSEENVRATRGVEDADRTRLLDQEGKLTAGAARPTTDALSTAATAGLTRVGAILGTPLYMSPEQCRGEILDARSDIYSLGVIAYQMLAGAPPFTGDTNSVIRAHTESQPKVLREHNRKLPKRVSSLIMSALDKDRGARPQTAAAFANAIRANVDGVGALYRRSFSLYSEYFPQFLKLSLLAHIPTILVGLMALAFGLAQPYLSKGVLISLALPLVPLQFLARFVTASTISGVTAIIITQLAVAPMKPVRLRESFMVLKRRWRPFVNTGLRLSLRIILGFILFVIPGLVMTARYLLWAPVVLMEGLEKKAARQRARALASRSWFIIVVVMLMHILVPAIMGAILGSFTGDHSKQYVRIRLTVASQLAQVINILVLPLLSIVPALVYLKMRQFGGETLDDIVQQLESVDVPRSQWQQRMRSRVCQ
jgi:serine/threonine protein kinase